MLDFNGKLIHYNQKQGLYVVSSTIVVPLRVWKLRNHNFHIIYDDLLNTYILGILFRYLDFINNILYFSILTLFNTHLL